MDKRVLLLNLPKFKEPIKVFYYGVEIFQYMYRGISFRTKYEWNNELSFEENMVNLTKEIASKCREIELYLQDKDTFYLSFDKSTWKQAAIQEGLSMKSFIDRLNFKKEFEEFVKDITNRLNEEINNNDSEKEDKREC